MAGPRVVTDSSCDLPADLVAELDVEVVPLTIRFGAEELVDRRDLSPKEFWARCATSPVLPETSAPSAGAFEDAYRRAADAGAEGVVCVTISSQLSATGQAAQMAAKSVQGEIPVRTVDSLSVTMGLGMLVKAAAELAATGQNVDDVAAAVESMVPRTRVYGALDTLENLKKGGRVGGAQALIGSMLSIKPIIEVRNGVVEPESKQRTRSRALRYLADKVRDEDSIAALAVMHGDAPDLDEFIEMLDPIVPREKMVVGDIGAVIGAHAGPRVLGVAYQVGAP
ncbi:MAG: DegV family protein [Acidimicrobiia bacterium]|nr:DegV family protein [Acidimicrobiia bacterium]